MYKVEIPSDITQRAAITRRQKLDEERKKRIFNPKLRVLGIDVDSLNAQVLEKAKVEEVLKQRDLAFAHSNNLTNSILQVMDDQVTSARRKAIRDISDFRKAHQQIETRREYDLNDPKSKAKNKPPRTDEYDYCGVSALQRFEGEDLAYEARLTLQKEQMRTWVKEQALEKLDRKKAQEEEAKLYSSLQNNVLAKLETLHGAVADARREQAKLDVEFNLHLAEEKKQRNTANKQRETEANLKEIETQINGQFLTETTNAVSGTSRKVRVDEFKGISDQEKRSIRAFQDQQRLETEMAKLKVRQEDQIWSNKSRASQRALILLERERVRQGKELAIQIQSENLVKQDEDALRQEYLDKVLYTNPPKDTYFAQFNTTSR